MILFLIGLVVLVIASQAFFFGDDDYLF